MTLKEFSEIFKDIIIPLAGIIVNIILVILLASLTSKIEKAKNKELKRKEWQGVWAELFLTRAVEFNNQISKSVGLINKLQHVKKEEQLAIALAYSENNYIIINLDWEIRNFSQFSKKYDDLTKKQAELYEELGSAVASGLTGKGDFNPLRKLQFEYNQLVKQIHNEILDI